MKHKQSQTKNYKNEKYKGIYVAFKTETKTIMEKEGYNLNVKKLEIKNSNIN